MGEMGVIDRLEFEGAELLVYYLPDYLVRSHDGGRG